MISVSDEVFEQLISDVMDELPQQYIKDLKNVAIVYEDEPTQPQRADLQLRCDQTLFGLYQGIPRTQRGAGYNMVLPDKITLFKNPMLARSNTMAELRKQVKHTLWHEVAHHYGLEHERIHELERKLK
jgi:predicted Zn-dependent protease with MMP-like domain